MRRTLVLVALVAAAGVLVLSLGEPPRRRTGRDAVRGAAVLRLRPGDVSGITVAAGGRGFAAVRRGDGWVVDGTPAAPAVAAAVQSLVETLAGLRAVDAFRTDDAAQFGLDEPGATIVVDGTTGRRTVDLGRFDSASSAIYARRRGHPRVFLVGASLGSAVERVLFQLEHARHPDAGAS